MVWYEQYMEKWGKYQEIYRDNMKNTDKIYVYKQKQIKIKQQLRTKVWFESTVYGTQIRGIIQIEAKTKK